MINEWLTPAFYAIVTPLLIAAVLFGRDWFAKSSLQAKQDGLLLTLENIRLNAEIAVKQAEAAVQEAARAKEAQAKLTETIAEVVLVTTSTNLKQAEIGVKVDGQMNNLHMEIAQLRNDLAASQLVVANEQERASILAVQREKEKGEAAVELAEAQKVATSIPATEEALSVMEGAHVVIPGTASTVVPVKEAPLIVKP